MRPTIFEAGDRPGGLGDTFEHDGIPIERFYHVILDTDAELLSLVDDLGLSGGLVERETGMGFHVGGRLYGFNTPLDLLRFGALPIADRIRTGLGALSISAGPDRARALDRIPAGVWLRRVFGRRVFETIWAPLLRAKFGDRGEHVPAYWVFRTLRREKSGRTERKLYVRGGYRAIADALAARIEARGGTVRLRTRVRALEVDGTGATVETAGALTPTLSRGERECPAERFDAAISTLPLPLLAGIARGPIACEIAAIGPAATIEYQGVVNVLVVARSRLERYYWTAVLNPAFPFGGVVETTHVIPLEWTGGRHLLYAMIYCHRASEPYRRSDAVLGAQALAGLAALYPRFRPADVEATYVFRAPFVEPVWPLRYLDRRPPARVGATRLYLATTAQAYPRTTSWNTSVALARDAARALAANVHATPPKASVEALTP